MKANLFAHTIASCAPHDLAQREAFLFARKVSACNLVYPPSLLSTFSSFSSFSFPQRTVLGHTWRYTVGTYFRGKQKKELVVRALQQENIP